MNLLRGDIKNNSEFLKSNSHLKISLLHLDVDIYKPTITALNYFWERLSTNGILIIDDYNSFEGITSALDDFLSEKGIRDNIHKTKFYSSPSYIIKS